MAQWLRVLTAHAEDLSRVPSTYVAWLATACNSSTGDPMPSGLFGPLHLYL